MTQRTAIPRQFSTARAARVRNIAIIATVLIAALAGPLALIVSGRAVATARQAVVDATPDDDPLHRGFAEAAAATWAYTGPPLPAYDDTEPRPVISADRAADLGINPALLDDNGRTPLDITHLSWETFMIVPLLDGRAVELHQFLVVTPEMIYRLTVPVTETPTADPDDTPRPALAGPPSLHPYLTDDRARAGNAAIQDWPPTWQTGRPTQRLTDRATEWAHAYLADDRRKLYELAADDHEVTYHGIGGHQPLDIAVPTAAVRQDGLTVARIHIRAVSDGGHLLNLHYDLLVGRVDEPLPTILSWGPRGSGPVLVAYQHGLVGQSPYEKPDRTDRPQAARP